MVEENFRLPSPFLRGQQNRKECVCERREGKILWPREGTVDAVNSGKIERKRNTEGDETEGERIGQNNLSAKQIYLEITLMCSRKPNRSKQFHKECENSSMIAIVLLTVFL